jgi:hypothetical protein
VSENTGHGMGPGGSLPTRHQLELAIEGWWGKGPTRELIIDACREMEVTLDEAPRVAQGLAEALDRGLHYITRVVVQQQVEMVRAKEKVKRFRVKSRFKDDSDFDSDRCLFSDVLNCPQCSAFSGQPLLHGRLLSPEELSTNISDAHQYLRDLFREADPSWMPKEKR